MPSGGTRLQKYIHQKKKKKWLKGGVWFNMEVFFFLFLLQLLKRFSLHSTTGSMVGDERLALSCSQTGYEMQFRYGTNNNQSNKGWSFGSARRAMASQMSVGFLGAGQIATALVRGFLAAGRACVDLQYTKS